MLNKVNRDRYHIFVDKTPTNLFLTDVNENRATIYLLETIDHWWQFFRYFNTVSYVEVGIVSDPIFDPEIGIKKRRIIISGIYAGEDSRVKNPGLPVYADISKIQDSYIYDDKNFGGTKLCKEK